MHVSLSGTLHSDEEMEIVFREWLQLQDPDYYHDRIFNFVPYWDKCMYVIRDRRYVDKVKLQ
jgi:hypothetical protein